MTTNQILQKTVDLAASAGHVRFSPKRRVMHMKIKGLQPAFAHLYFCDEGLWVNFDFGGMSGNDPIHEFYWTLKNVITEESGRELCV